MTCRANHLDQSHVHIMPPYTWMMPTRGIDNSRMDQTHKVTRRRPKDGPLQLNWLVKKVNGLQKAETSSLMRLWNRMLIQ